jgi:PAS domain S-box-containing protein
MKDQSTTKQPLIIKKASLDALEYAENIINTVREPLIVLDQDLRVVTASRSFYEFFKVKPEETGGQLIYNLGNKQWDIPKLRELLENILPRKTTFDNYEVEHEFATIGRRIMLLNARQIQRASGKGQIILLAIEDITERKRLENLLTESEERYRHLFETANDGIVLLEKSEGKITHTNPAAEKMLGYNKKELIGNSLQDIGFKLDTGDFQTTMQNLNKIGIIKCNDVPIKTKSGLYIDTDIYFADRSILVQCNIRDVTERKRVEDMIRESEEKYKTLFEDAQDGIALADAETSLLIDCNQALCRMVERDKRELMGQAQNILHPPEDLVEGLSPTFHKHQTEQPDQALEDRLMTRGGRLIPVEIRASKIRINNRDFLLGIFRNITERKREEEALLASREQMRSLANRLQMAREEERTRIARKIHDEIGGLLTGLKIDLSLLLRTSLEMEDKAIKKSLLDGIESMIKSIDVSVPEIRRLAMELRPGVLDELGFIAAMEWHLHDFQNRTGINCKWISSVEHINLDIDFSTALFRIFQEALTNVARHSGATEVRTYLRAGEQSIVLEVEDNGKGFENETLLSSEALGFLGMKERVQIFGGSVTITGKPGMGTKVTVNIPSMEKRKTDQEGDAG